LLSAQLRAGDEITATGRNVATGDTFEVAGFVQEPDDGWLYVLQWDGVEWFTAYLSASCLDVEEVIFAVPQAR
jgi:hypothetical protein